MHSLSETVQHGERRKCEDAGGEVCGSRYYAHEGGKLSLFVDRLGDCRDASRVEVTTDRSPHAGTKFVPLPPGHAVEFPPGHSRVVRRFGVFVFHCTSVFARLSLLSDNFELSSLAEASLQYRSSRK